MKNFETKKEIIEQILGNLGDEELREVHNNYCEETRREEDWVYANTDDQLNDFFINLEPCYIIRRVCFGEYIFADPYFVINGYGNLRSGYIKDFVFLPEIAEYIVKEVDALENDKIQEQLNEWTNEEAKKDSKDEE